MKKAKSKEFLPIERDEDFVHRGEERSGWEDTHSSLSSYVLGGNSPSTVEGQIKEIYQLCRNRSNNMNPGGDHKLLFRPDEETAKTTGKKVYVSTKILDEKKSFNEKADIMLGFTTHEMAHVVHTNFDLMKTSIKSKFTHSIWNIIEDERIEHIIGEEYPGYAGNLKTTKDYVFNEKYLLAEALKRKKKLKTLSPVPVPAIGTITHEGDEEEEKDDHLVAEDPKEGLTEEMTAEEESAMELYDLVFKYIRYPKHIDPAIAAKHEVELDEIKAMLSPYPTTAAEVVEVAHKVAKAIHTKIEDDMTSSSTPTGPGGMKGAVSAIEEMLGGMMEEIESPTETEDPEMAEELKNPEPDFDYRDEYIEDTEWKAVFRKGINDKDQFQKMLSEVKGDAQRLANVLYTKVYSEKRLLRGMRSGDLDDSKIVEAVKGVKTVHTTTIPKLAKQLNIVVLIDESGSMHGNKARNAAKVGVLIQEAYRIFPVGQLFIYGFTSDHGEDFNTIYRYKEPGLDLRYGLGSVRGRSNNRDGHAIRAVANRVRSFTPAPMIYFIISDGQPAGERYYGEAAMKDTRKAVHEVTSRKFFPIQIGIESISITEQKKMFDDFVNYTDSRKMVEEIRKLLLNKGHKYSAI